MCDRPDYVSSRSRYDLFDTSPYEILRKQHTETLCRKTARRGFLKMHGKVQKPQCLCGIVREASFIYASVSSQPRYDHFDTSPYMLNSYLSITNYSIFIERGAPLCPVAVPEKIFVLERRIFSTAATPFCSLHLPPAALANVPTSIRLRI